MTLVVVVGAAASLVVLPGVLDRVGRRLQPREWAWLCAVGLGGGLALTEMVLVLRAAPTLLRAAGVGWLATACERVLRPLVIGGPVLGWTAAAAAVILPIAALASWRRARRLRARLAADLWLGDARVIGGHTVVVLPVPRPLALSFGHDGESMIVLSDGLLDGLDGPQIEAVVRHEAAHVRHRHQRFLAVAAIAEGVLGRLPPVARTAAALRLAVERWADEEAAGPTRKARVALRDSLLRLAGVAPVAGVAAFTDAGTVAARVTALDFPPPRPRLPQHAMVYVPGTMAGAVAAPAVITWGGHVHMLLAMAGRCTI